MKTIKSIAAVCLLLVVGGLSSATAQDFGQLLTAVDKLESSLKKLVNQETEQRASQIEQLQKQIDAISTNGSGGDALKRFQKELAELKTQSRQWAESGAGTVISESQLVEMLNDIEFLKAQNAYLTDYLEDHGAKLASAGGDSRALVTSAYVEQLAGRLEVLNHQVEELASGRDTPVAGGSPSKSHVKAGPKYHNLRFKDDYGYLDDPSNRGNDFFDPLKRIHIGGSTELSFGGQYRLRYESDNKRKLGAGNPTSQEAYLNRLLLFADLKVANLFRLFTEFKFAGITNNELAAPALAHDRPDLENLFVDGWVFNSKKTSLGTRIGRQELQFGKQRLISPLNWANTRRTFDGVRIMSKFSGWTIDGFVTRPVNVDPTELNQSDAARLFSGLYTSKKLKKHTFSGYFLVYTKNAPVNLATRLSSDFEYLTLGTGYDGKGGRFDWGSEIAFQFGGLGDKSISAYMISLNGGYSFKEHPFKPRLGLGWDIASGDDNPDDNKVKTFHQQFPLGHAYLGWADQVGRRNINAFSVQLSAKPSRLVTTKLNWFSFGLVEAKDALYNAGGKATRQDIAGLSGQHVGTELDALVIFKLNRHASFHLGYLHFKPGDFVANTGPSESHNMLYVMLPVTF